MIAPFGIPVRIHPSLAVLALAGGLAVWAALGAGAAARAVMFMSATFASVLLHEFGHALAARAFGIRTLHITLYPFGGVAAILGLPPYPWQEILIAVAGPGVNFALAALLGGGGLLLGNAPLAAAGALNALMGLFNLLPAFPMDGGRVLRALLSGRIGHLRATSAAIAVGRVFAWAFIAVAILARAPGLLLVGLFLFVALAAERARLKAQARRLPAAAPAFRLRRRSR